VTAWDSFFVKEKAEEARLSERGRDAMNSRAGKPPVWALVVGVIVLLLIGGAILYQGLGGKGTDFNYDKPGYNFTLQNLDGKNVTLKDTDGKVRLVYFYYASCPDVCQPTSYFLSKVQERLKEEKLFGKDTAILSITFDPVRDTPEKLKEFAALLNADTEGWYFLRGDEAYSIDLAAKWDIGVMKQPNGDIAHTNVIFLVDKKGQIRHYYNANNLDLDPNQIVKDMKGLAKSR
jgi:protein SCO1